MSLLQQQINRAIVGLASRQEREASKKTTPGDSPLFREIRHRIAKNMDSRIIIQGEAGIGKSYASLRCAEKIDPVFVNEPERAVKNQVVFSAADFLNAVQTLPPFSVLIYDEPGQSFHHREFMSEANIILSKTMIGFRLKRFITFLNVPNLGIIDKDAKTLVSFMINMTGPGKGEVFKQLPDKFGNVPWFKTIVDDQRFALPSVQLRHAYEKKKQEVQDALYAKYGKQLSDKEKPARSNSDIVELIKADPLKYGKEENTTVTALMGDFDIGRERARAIRRKLSATDQ